MSYAKYGLTATNASGANLDKGIVEGPDGKFYQIDGFKHGQEDGLDKDQATKAFDGALEAAGREGGFDPSNFNTAGDVQNALQALKAPEEEKEVPLKDVELSERLATARARASQYEEDRVSGQAAKDLYDPENNSAQGFLDRYKLKLGERLENGNYKTPDHSSTNSSKVGSGENDVSLDTSEFARTGKDNREDY